MKKGISVLGICLIMLVLFGTSHGAFCASLDLTLDTTGSSRTNFDSGIAYTYAWHGNILYNGASLGVFNAEYTAQTFNGYLTKYDLVIPGGETIPEFISILVSNKPITPAISLNKDAAILGPPPGPTLIAKGSIVATSSALLSLVGASVDLFQLGSASPYFRITY